MKTYAYTRKSLESFCNDKDKIRFELRNQREISDAVSRLHERLKLGVMPYHFKTFTKRGRKMCMPRDYETALLLRKVNDDFSRLTGSNFTSRSETISALKEACSEAHPMLIIRLDIKKFYESISSSKVIDFVRDGLRSTYALQRYVEQYLRWSDSNIGGVPTGISLSASLAEYYIRNSFDNKLRYEKGIHFYRRYVDDIIMICSPDQDADSYVKTVEKHLPDELRLNSSPDKKSILKILTAKDCGSFSYLGYRFSLGAINKSSDPHTRPVGLDISDNKIAKRKTRHALALLQFLKDGNEADLRRRFLLLNSGYSFWDSSRGRLMNAGICNTYSEIDLPSNALKSLQAFYRSSLLNPKFQLHHRLKLSHLSKDFRGMVMSFDLEDHVRKRKYFNFSADELEELTQCWKND